MLFLALIVLFLLSANNIRERSVTIFGVFIEKGYWWLLLLLRAFGKILEMMFGGLVKQIITMVTAAEMLQKSLSLLFHFLSLCWHEIMWPSCWESGMNMSVIFVMQLKKRERSKHVKTFIFRIWAQQWKQTPSHWNKLRTWEEKSIHINSRNLILNANDFLN